MDHFIRTVISTCDFVKAKKRAKKNINLSFDEWNVWFHADATDADTMKNRPWQIAPHLLEDHYDFEDALLVGLMLITLMKHSDRVKIACLAQLVNVIAPIMTENDGAAWAQTIFYPYMYASRFGRGKALKTVTECENYTTTDKFTVPYVESSVIVDAENCEIVVFAVNRSLDEDMELSLDLGGFDTAVMKEHIELYADHLKTVNTKECQNVAPKSREINVQKSAYQQVTLNKHSWNMIRFGY